MPPRRALPFGKRARVEEMNAIEQLQTTLELDMPSKPGKTQHENTHPPTGSASQSTTTQQFITESNTQFEGGRDVEPQHAIESSSGPNRRTRVNRYDSKYANASIQTEIPVLCKTEPEVSYTHFFKALGLWEDMRRSLDTTVTDPAFDDSTLAVLAVTYQRDLEDMLDQIYQSDEARSRVEGRICL
jgi:hypothetical protein